MNRNLFFVTFMLLLVLFVGPHPLTASPVAAQGPQPGHPVYLPLVVKSGTPSNLPPVQVTLDPSRAVQATIDSQGGSLHTTAANGTTFKLIIPPNALDFSEVITMTPAAAVDNLPLSGGLAGAVNLEPAGLTFYEPAILRITPAVPLSGPLTTGFAYEGEGAQFHLRLLANAAGASEMSLSAGAELYQSMFKLRGYGVGAGTQADVTRRQQAQPRPSDPMDNWDELFVPYPPPVSMLSQLFEGEVYPLLEAARTNPTLTDQALLSFNRWYASINEYQLHAKFITEIARGKYAIANVLNRAAETSAERCFSQKRPEEGFALLRWVRYAKKFLGSAEVADIERRLPKCLTFKVTFHSIITETDSGYGYYYELRSDLTLKATSGTRATGSAPLHYVDTHWTGGGSCAFTVVGHDSTFDAQGTGFGFTLTPVSRTSPAVNVTFRYDPGLPGEDTTFLCPKAPPVSASTNAWYVYFDEMHAYERELTLGYRVTSQIVGAGTFTGWVYHHTTTGPGGQAVVEDTEINLEHTPER